MATIHPTALVDHKAELAGDVTIGAYCIIKGKVHIGAGTIVGEMTHIHGHTVIGSRCRLGPAAYIGMDPQDLKYAGDQTSLMIGDDVVVRETATIHRSATSDAHHATRIGNSCFIMAAAHVAHDCELGNNVILANAVLLGGHVTIGERSFLGGGFALHQFCRIGRLAVVAGNEALSHDIPPFAAVRERGLRGYNAVGCRRAGISPRSVVAIRAAYQRLRAHRQVSEAVAAIEAQVPQVPEVVEMLQFIAASRRGIVPSLPSLKARRRLTDAATEDFGD